MAGRSRSSVPCERYLDDLEQQQSESESESGNDSVGITDWEKAAKTL